MPEVLFDGQSYALDENETVLDGLERNGIGIPNSCRSGVCQSCLMRSVNGDPPADAQKGLKQTLQAQGYFLSCICKPDGDLEISRADDAAQRTSARIVALEPLNDRVMKVTLATDGVLDYFPGQFINFVREPGIVRSYSLASVPGLDDELECHVAIIPGGAMSGWLHREAEPGDALDLMGPLGNCFYMAGNPDQPLFLLGTGTGLAPLYGIARDALNQGHEADVHLFHGALKREDLYLVEELYQLDADHANFHFHACVMNEVSDSRMTQGSIDEVALQEVPDLKGWKVYLCGDPNLIRQVQRKTFMAGASMKDIHADAFLPAGGATS